MTQVNVFYPSKEGARFDWAYYLGTHVPLARRLFGGALKSISIQEGLAGFAPGAPAAFVAMAQLTFDSVPAFQSAFAPIVEELMGDIPKYTSIEPIIQFSEVKL